MFVNLFLLILTRISALTNFPASSTIGVVAGIAGVAGVMFIIAAIVIVVVYANVKKRLKVINQTIKTTSPTKASFSSAAPLIAAKNEPKYENIMPLEQIDKWDESEYNIDRAHTRSDLARVKNNYKVSFSQSSSDETPFPIGTETSIYVKPDLDI